MSRKNQTKWTIDEIRLLVDLYEGGLSVHMIATKLARSETAVKTELYELRRRSMVRQSKKIYADDWSEVEDDFLRKNLGRMSNTALSVSLGRSIPAVQKRASELSNESTNRSLKIKRSKFINSEYISSKAPSTTGFKPAFGVSVRSRWENNVLAYLNHKNIKWEYEPHLFVFEGVTRGAKAYLPDIYLPAPQDKWIEVKGRLHSVSKTKTKRFKQFYPEEFAKLEVVVEKNSEADKFYRSIGVPIFMYYNDLKKKFSNIPNWE